MSRNGINEDMVVGFGRGMDLLTIDASRLKLPFGKGRGRGAAHALLGSPGSPVEAKGLACGVRGRSDCEPAAPRKDVVIDVRARGEPKPPPVESQSLLEIPGLLVPSGYALFALSLGLTNLISPGSGSAVCVLFSPVPMLCLAIHALGVQPWVGAGLLLCCWTVPFVCAAWNLGYCLVLFVVLGVCVAAGTRRLLSSACLVALLLSMPLALQPQWTGVEQRWGVTVAGFFLALQCVAASAGGGRVVYRIKQLGV
jgi:hypothetical protein